MLTMRNNEAWISHTGLGSTKTISVNQSTNPMTTIDDNCHMLIDPDERKLEVTRRSRFPGAISQMRQGTSTSIGLSVQGNAP